MVPPSPRLSTGVESLLVSFRFVLKVRLAQIAGPVHQARPPALTACRIGTAVRRHPSIFLRPLAVKDAMAFPQAPVRLPTKKNTGAIT
jgi:hypothetical protein